MSSIISTAINFDHFQAKKGLPPLLLNPSVDFLLDEAPGPPDPASRDSVFLFQKPVDSHLGFAQVLTEPTNVMIPRFDFLHELPPSRSIYLIEKSSGCVLRGLFSHPAYIVPHPILIHGTASKPSRESRDV